MKVAGRGKGVSFSEDFLPAWLPYAFTTLNGSCFSVVNVYGFHVYNALLNVECL